ncbi:MAG TPA: response regulator transcription factor [Nocardioides sp.]|uniref:response regulator transcription factor n=1 Tax=Nocardioides sp. TaxID=35761 RepID=UPI002F42060F
MRLVVCDDHVMFLDALATALDSLGHDVAGTSRTLDDVPALIERESPDACLLDLWFGDEQSLDLARDLRRNHPSLDVVLLTGDVAPEAIAALEDGTVQAVAHKTWKLALIHETLVRIATGAPIRRLMAMPSPSAHGDGPRLTTREHEVLDLMATGASTIDIRHRLGVSEHTVRSHVRNVLAKLGAHTRVEAVRRAHEQGLVRAAGGGTGR